MDKPLFEQLFEGMEVPKEYLEKLGNEEWVYENLIIKGQITTIVATSGYGKTSIMFSLVAPHAVENGFIVYYFDLDSPANDHKRMARVAEDGGFTWINTNTLVGVGQEKIAENLEVLVNSPDDIDRYVLVFDTLKKFNDMMSKSSTREFFKLMRQLTGKGATIVLLAHTNKRAEADGHHTFEGVGDIKNDSDALIIITADQKPDSIVATTIISSLKNPNVKTRGIYKPISFRIGKDRSVQQLENYIPQSEVAKQLNALPTPEDIMEVAYKCIRDCEGKLDKEMLVSAIRDSLPNATVAKTKKILEDYISKYNNDPNAVAFFKVLEKGKRQYWTYEYHRTYIAEINEKRKKKLEVDMNQQGGE